MAAGSWQRRLVQREKQLGGRNGDSTCVVPSPDWGVLSLRVPPLTENDTMANQPEPGKSFGAAASGPSFARLRPASPGLRPAARTPEAELPQAPSQAVLAAD